MLSHMQRRLLAVAVPLFCGFLLFYLIPFVHSIYYSVTESAFSDRFVGLANYLAVSSNQYYQLALRNTFELALTGVPLLIVLSLGLAVALNVQGEQYAMLRSAIVLPMLLPTASVVPLFRQLFAEKDSPVLLWIQSLGFSSEQIARLPVQLLYLWKNAGFNVVLLMAALMMIPRDIYEAAALDGARGLRKFRSITLPLITPTLFFVSVLSVVQSLRIFKEAYLLYGAYPDASIYLVQHYMNNHFYKLNYQNLTSGAILFALTVYALVVVGYRFERRMDVGL